MSEAATVLVVEDNPATRKMLRVTLATEGYGVVEVGDARGALAVAEKRLPDLVLQDLILPDMDGFELLRRLRALPGGTELPILVLSGFLTRLEESRRDAGGFTALLVKPIEPSRLVDAIRVHLPQQYTAPGFVGEGRRLLIVDDDPVQLKLARLHFSHLGYVVTAAGSAAEALEQARAKAPDVILSDVFMPQMDGFQFCVEVRADPTLAHVPLVLISGQYGSSADRDLARRVGANALVLRTPDFGHAAPAILEALKNQAPVPAEQRSAELELRHARLVIHQLERQAAAMAGLSQRCGVQAAQLSLLSGVADALTNRGNIDAALRDVLAATLDAAGISKGALMLRAASGLLELRQEIGFSAAESAALRRFFGHAALLDDIVRSGGSVTIPSDALPRQITQDILEGANVASAQIVPLVSDGRGMGVMLIGATRTDVTTEDSVAFARAMGNQVVQSLELADSVARLTASEQRYRALLEHANDYIAVLTPDGIVREMNQRWVELTGLSHRELIGRHIRGFTPAASDDDGRNALTELIAGRTTSTPPVEIAARTGTVVLLEFSGAIVDVGDERLVFTTGRDVSEQRLLEEQLRQAQKLEAVGQLAGGVAHDFNNVLTVILGFCDLMMDGLSPDDHRTRDLIEIKKAGDRAAGLTRQLLAFSRKQVLQPRVLSINTVIAGMETMFKRLIVEDVNLRVVLAPDIGLVLMDPTQLEQILINLVVNAADAMPRGGKLTIETGNVTLDEHYQQRHLPVVPGNYVLLAVSDTGIGMDEQVTRRIFEPFFTTKGAGKGTGLGLATTYGIVKQSGGNIGVYSEPGYGSTFKVYLPQVGTAAGIVERPKDATDVPRGTETILLVEDDEAVRMLARVTLERAGYRVLAARHPVEAMRLADAVGSRIHLLLSDVIMPESEGPPLYDRIARSNRGLRVLYMSGYTDEAVVRHGVLVEGTPFLQKPFTPLILARKVRDVLDAARQW